MTVEAGQPAAPDTERHWMAGFLEEAEQWKTLSGEINLYHYTLNLQLASPEGRVSAIRAPMTARFWPEDGQKPLLIVKMDYLEVRGVSVWRMCALLKCRELFEFARGWINSTESTPLSSLANFDELGEQREELDARLQTLFKLPFSIRYWRGVGKSEGNLKNQKTFVTCQAYSDSPVWSHSGSHQAPTSKSTASSSTTWTMGRRSISSASSPPTSS